MDRGATKEALSGPFSSALRDTLGTADPAGLVATSMLFQSLVHDTNALRGILGEPEEVLSAHAWRGGLAQTSLTRFAGNVRVLLTWVSLPGLKHYEERMLFASPEKRLTLTFPSPYLRHFPTPLVVERTDGADHVAEHRTVSYEEAFREELHAFRRCVRDGQKPETCIEDALGDARWIQAIARCLSPPPAKRAAALAPRPNPRARHASAPKKRRR